MTNSLYIAIKDLPIIARVSDWQNGRRYYVTLACVRGSRANADLRTKMYIAGNELIIERGKGYHSQDWCDQERVVTEAIVAAGGTVREI